MKTTYLRKLRIAGKPHIPENCLFITTAYRRILNIPENLFSKIYIQYGKLLITSDIYMFQKPITYLRNKETIFSENYALKLSIDRKMATNILGGFKVGAQK